MIDVICILQDIICFGNMLYFQFMSKCIYFIFDLRGSNIFCSVFDFKTIFLSDFGFENFRNYWAYFAKKIAVEKVRHLVE